MSDIVKIVKDLLTLPPNTCKACGKCCVMSIYKGGLTYEEVVSIANSTTADPFVVQSTKDFLTVFKPFESVADAKKVDAKFVEQVLSKLGEDSKVAFFECRFVTKDNKCPIHEDRPELCRAYPLVHESTMFFEGCGYEQYCRRSWAKIKEIINSLEEKKKIW